MYTYCADEVWLWCFFPQSFLTNLTSHISKHNTSYLQQLHNSSISNNLFYYVQTTTSNKPIRLDFVHIVQHETLIKTSKLQLLSRSSNTYKMFHPFSKHTHHTAQGLSNMHSFRNIQENTKLPACKYCIILTSKLRTHDIKTEWTTTYPHLPPYKTNTTLRTTSTIHVHVFMYIISHCTTISTTYIYTDS